MFGESYKFTIILVLIVEALVISPLEDKNYADN